MFIRSKDGRHLTEAKTVDLDEKVILVNGVVFAQYDSEEEAADEFLCLCQECCDSETFYDLADEIEDSYDDDDWDDEDEGDGSKGFEFRYP